MPEPNEFEVLLEACRRGEPGALDVLARRYLPHVRTAVRSRLSAVLRARFDSHDFAQDVWASFFRITLDRLDLADESALVGYLSQMARLKVAEEYRHQTTRKVGLTRNTPLDGDLELGLTGRGHTPSAEVIATDQWERLTDGLSDRQRRMLAMLRDGATHVAVADEFGLSEKTVRRLVARLTDPRRPAG